MAGRVVFVHRGGVPFASKVRAAQNAGVSERETPIKLSTDCPSDKTIHSLLLTAEQAAAVIIINHADDPVLVDAHTVVGAGGRIETIDECAASKRAVEAETEALFKENASRLKSTNLMTSDMTREFESMQEMLVDKARPLAP